MSQLVWHGGTSGFLAFEAQPHLARRPANQIGGAEALQPEANTSVEVKMDLIAIQLVRSYLSSFACQPQAFFELALVN